MLRKYMIERNIPAVGMQPPEAMCGVAQTSKNVLAGLAPRVQWVESFVTQNKVYCVFLAEDASLVREHATRTGFPADAVEEIRSMLDPTMAPA
jgi:hypothetical protein